MFAAPFFRASPYIAPLLILPAPTRFSRRRLALLLEPDALPMPMSR